jgi:hypothetical protein
LIGGARRQRTGGLAGWMPACRIGSRTDQVRRTAHLAVRSLLEEAPWGLLEEGQPGVPVAVAVVEPGGVSVSENPQNNRAAPSDAGHTGHRHRAWNAGHRAQGWVLPGSPRRI